MGLPPWETSDSQLFVLITGANSGLGHSIAVRLIDEFLTSPNTPLAKHLILILCTRTPIKTRYAISRLRGHVRKVADYSPFAAQCRAKAAAAGTEYKWEHTVMRVHFIGVEADLCDLKSVYACAHRLVNGTVGSPDATTYDGLRLPHGSPGTQAFSDNVVQDRWALSQQPGSSGFQRSWGWGLSGVRIPRIDAVVLNAGIGGWTGVDFVMATKDILLDLCEAVTWPRFKISEVGTLVRPQASFRRVATAGEQRTLVEEKEGVDEPPLGEVFCSNVFGHYILAHELMPLLSRPASITAKAGGKIIWLSSVEGATLNIDDIQGLKAPAAYESSKQLIDFLVFGSELSAVKRVAATFFDVPDGSSKAEGAATKDKQAKPRMFVTHPGIFASEILPLNFILVALYKFVFLIARWCGSPWHSISPDKAAVAPVWVALADEETVENMDMHNIKWGSSTDRGGNERVIHTDVPGWGWDGTLEGAAEGKNRIGRRKTAVDLTKEAREDFEDMAAKCWRQMEDLRKMWESILGVKK
ncbi:hypothetical protein BJ878DRAFT_500353 [Calycina marina]|uniref:3-keto-steroid reductase n=1 Tax=Calycina marina TaxID=1763456 RepID=A0A9P7Z6D1_9HELO|nr:hypothetical protein BJ878DRAFT_500353 [Calycina marina]